LERLQRLTQAFYQAYEGGQQSCLLSVLSMGESKDLFSAQIQPALRTLIGAIAQVLVEAGIEKTLAQQRAEDAVLQVQGALMLARALGDTAPFQRVLRQLPEQMLS
jgi:TetR/AcrR family transcriptional regulator, lmrAB and yxaGH operons repressor